MRAGLSEGIEITSCGYREVEGIFLAVFLEGVLGLDGGREERGLEGVIKDNGEEGGREGEEGIVIELLLLK